MSNEDLYQRLADATGISRADLISMTGGSMTNIGEQEFAARLLNSEGGQQLMNRLASELPQVYLGMVTNVQVLGDGSCDVSYVEESGCHLGFNRPKHYVPMLLSNGLRVGAVIAVYSAVERGQQRVQDVIVQNMKHEALLDFAVRVISNHDENDLYR